MQEQTTEDLKEEIYKLKSKLTDYKFGMYVAIGVFSLLLLCYTMACFGDLVASVESLKIRVSDIEKTISCNRRN